MTAVPAPNGGRASGGDVRRPAPGLEVDFHLPERAMEIAFRAPAGETTALVGHNGAGKTSTFEVVAGILRPARARVRLGERILQDSGTEGTPADRATASGGEVWTPPHERGVVQVVQRPLLFPTMSVLENAAFGLRASGTPAREARRAARDMLERLDAGDLADRRPRELSGGQAQRVAIARALVTSPELLLLDEPFAALDAGSATLVRRLLADQLEGRSALLISHDADTVRALATHLVVLSHGRVVHSGPRACEDAESFLPNRPRDR